MGSDDDQSRKQPRFFFKTKSTKSENKTVHYDDEACKLENLVVHNATPDVVNCNNCSDNMPRYPLVKIAGAVRLSSEKSGRKRRRHVGVFDEVLRKLKGSSPEGGEIDVHGCKLTMADVTTSFEPKNASVNCNNCSGIKGTPLVKVLNKD